MLCERGFVMGAVYVTLQEESPAATLKSVKVVRFAERMLGWGDDYAPPVERASGSGSLRAWRARCTT